MKTLLTLTALVALSFTALPNHSAMASEAATTTAPRANPIPNPQNGVIWPEPKAEDYFSLPEKCPPAAEVLKQARDKANREAFLNSPNVACFYWYNKNKTYVKAVEE